MVFLREECNVICLHFAKCTDIKAPVIGIINASVFIKDLIYWFSFNILNIYWDLY